MVPSMSNSAPAKVCVSGWPLKAGSSSTKGMIAELGSSEEFPAGD